MLSRDPDSTSGLQQRVLGNFSRLIGGRSIAAILSFGATAITARALGPAEFGLVILVHAYVITIKALLNFKPFEAVIRYGVPALERNDRSSLRLLLQFGLRIDVISSLSSTTVALLSVPIASRTFDWNAELTGFAYVYSLVLLGTVTGTAKGALRLFNRFDLLGTQLTMGPCLRAFGVTVAWLLNLPMPAFLFVWGFAMLLEQGYLIFCGWREIKRRLGSPLLGGGLTIRQAHDHFPGIGAFLGVVYWQSNIDLVPKQAATLLIGGLLGSAEAGMFRLAREIAGVLTTPALLLRQVLFPDLARIWYRGENGFMTVVLRVTCVAGLSGLVVTILSLAFGASLLSLVYGEVYRAAASLLSLLLLAGSLDLSISALRAAGYAAGLAGRFLSLSAISILLYLLLFFMLTPGYGLSGPGVAACVASTLSLVGMLTLMHRQITPRKFEAKRDAGT